MNIMGLASLTSAILSAVIDNALILAARILVIDDAARIRRFLRIPLEAEGHGVIEAGTARDGILAVVREAPGLVILDLGLPGADGLLVLREIGGCARLGAGAMC